MTQFVWMLLVAALGFIDGWLACWWIGLIAQARRKRDDAHRARMEKLDEWSAVLARIDGRDA